MLTLAKKSESREGKSMRIGTASVALTLLLAACSQDTTATGFTPTLSYTFEPIAVGSGEEVSGVCQSWTLNNDEPLYVSKILQRNEGGWHHSNWSFVPEDVYDGPDGTWNCDDRGFHEVSAGLEGGTFFAQSTQTLEELQAFQEGAVLEIPPRHRIVGGVHLLNVSAAPMNSALTFEIETIPEEDVRVKLRPVAFTNTALDIRQQAESRFGMTCDLSAQFDSTLGTPPDYNIYYVLAHYHEWGNYFRLSFVDDEGGDRTILELQSSVGEPLGSTIDPPISSQGASSLRVECGYMNTTDRDLEYGLGGQEMCVFLAYIDADIKIGAASGGNTALGPNEDGVYMNETACGPILAAPAN